MALPTLNWLTKLADDNSIDFNQIYQTGNKAKADAEAKKTKRDPEYERLMADARRRSKAWFQQSVGIGRHSSSRAEDYMKAIVEAQDPVNRMGILNSAFIGSPYFASRVRKLQGPEYSWLSPEAKNRIIMNYFNTMTGGTPGAPINRRDWADYRDKQSTILAETAGYGKDNPKHTNARDFFAKQSDLNLKYESQPSYDYRRGHPIPNEARPRAYQLAPKQSDSTVFRDLDYSEYARRLRGLLDLATNTTTTNKNNTYVV